MPSFGINFLLVIICCLIGTAPALVAPPSLHRCAPASGYRGTVLFAKKTAKAKKIQVRLLKNVGGTGQKGDVVQVTPAFFQNKLMQTQSAEVISDEAVQEMESEKAAAKEEEQKRATSLKEKIMDVTINIKRKAGPDGQLFGGIGPKFLIEELQSQVQDDFLEQKTVKITAIMDEDGKQMRSDIKHTGDYGAKISLTKEISAEFKVSVQDE